MKIVKSLLLCALLSVAGPGYAGKGRELLDAFLNNTNTMQADFQQKLLDAGGLMMQQTSGKFLLKRPGKFVWDYLEPYPQKIVSNGQRIWIYDSELEQVSIKPYSQVLTGAPVILLDQRQDLDKEFKVEEKGLVDDQHWITLTPRSPDNEFKEIRVGMMENRLRTLMLVDAFEQTTVIEFDHLQINPMLDDERFRFQPPPGTDVVGDG